MANKITTLLEFETGGGIRSLGQLRTELKNTDGALNKVKVGAKGAGDLIRTNIAEGALAAGAALVAFGAKSAKAFQDTALEAKNLASLTGDTVEESSRLNAIWKQSGADAKDLQDVLLQMNGVLATNKTLVKELGIDLNDGATVGQRFQQVADALDQIPDAAKRSQIASQVFGEEGVRQYNALRNAVGDVGEAMEGVSDAQVIDPEEVEKAERMREAMKRLELAISDVSMEFGESLVPAIEDAAWALSQLNRIPVPSLFKQGAIGATREAFKKLGDALKKDVNPGLAENVKETANAAYEATLAAKALDDHAEAAESGASAQDIIADAIADATEEFDRQEEAAKRSRDALRDNADAVYDLYDAEASLEDAITNANEVMAEIANGEFEGSQRDARDAIVDVAQAADDQARALVETKGLSVETAAGMAEWTRSMLTTANTLKGPMREEVLNHIARVTGIPKSILTTFGVEVDPGALAALESLLARLGRVAQNRFATVSAVGTRGGARVDGPETGPGRASGGPTRAGVRYPILEEGKSEVLTEGGRSYLLAARNGQVTPLSDMSDAAGASYVTNNYITVNTMPGPETERTIANLVARYNQRNGR